MRHSHSGSIVPVTLPRALHPGEARTAWMPAHQVPTGVSLPATPVGCFLASEHRHITQSFYRRPLHRR